MNYEKDIKIDETALDVEWLEQPRLMLKYTKHQALMEREMLNAKEEVELCRAELDREIRSDPDKFGVAKITETVVNNLIISNEKYKETYDEYLEMKYEYEVAKGAVQAFRDRKEALENLVRLHGQQYFAGPSVPRDLSKEWQDKQKQTQANKTIKLKRK